jgi:hypothetical protein
VDGCQGQGILEESSSGSQDSHWSVALIMISVSRKRIIRSAAL